MLTHILLDTKTHLSIFFVAQITVLHVSDLTLNVEYETCLLTFCSTQKLTCPFCFFVAQITVLHVSDLTLNVEYKTCLLTFCSTQQLTCPFWSLVAQITVLPFYV
jgi:hypothetical protein